MTYLTRGSCTVGTPTGQYPLTVTGPLGATASITTDTAYYSNCLPGNTTQTATFDVDLAGAFGGAAPDGDYTVTFSSCCRISPIQNMTGTSTVFSAKVHKTTGQASASPVMNSKISTGIAKGYAYKQFLNASDPDGTAITYASQAGSSEGPNTDVITLQSSGEVGIPASTTATFAGGQNFVYRVRAIDAQGDYAERDILLTVTANNKPPQITGLDGEPVFVAPGTTATVQLGGTDPNNASPKVDTVSLAPVGLPSWVTFTSTPGNPASGTLTIAPPPGTPDQTLSVAIDAVDNDATAPLTDSATLQIVVGALPQTTLSGTPATVTNEASPTFTFSSDVNAGFECRVDAGAWAVCASPFRTPAFTDGSHTFDVRAVDGIRKDSTPASFTFTVDTTAPTAPEVLRAPEGRTDQTSATIAFQGETAGGFSCSIDGGPWVACASPLTLAGVAVGTHEVRVRQTDQAGNAGAVRTVAWTVVAPPTAAPKPAPAGAAPKLTALVGDGGGSQRPGTSSGATIKVEDKAVGVGCHITGTVLTACRVDLYADAPSGTRARAAARVLVGTGTYERREGSANLRVKVVLNAVGRALLARSPAGLKVSVKVTGTPVSGKALRATGVARLVPQRVTATIGGFAIDSARLTGAAKRSLLRLAKQVGKAERVRCVGHTEGPSGNARHLYRLGMRRAKTVCAYLAAHGVKARWQRVSRGPAVPRATNGTAAGRALNRRVELRIDR